MSRKKTQEAEIEFGILQNYGDSDELITIEDAPAKEQNKIAPAIITIVDNGKLWINFKDLGYIIVTDKIEPWMRKGEKVGVVYEGTPGEADFKITGVQEW